MKRSLLFSSILFLGLAFVLIGCKKDDPEPTPTPTPTPATTGGLVVKVQLEGSTGYLTGAIVGLATSEENLYNEIYLRELETNSSGQANFGQLNPGNYYYDCYYELGFAPYYGVGQVQIVAGQNQELTLTMIP
jgi:hypothetical protein